MSTTKTILGASSPRPSRCILYMSYFVVDERQKALVLRFGDINRIVEEPGLYFKLPIADTVTPIEDRIIIWENNDRPVQDVARQVYIVDAITLARIKDARLFRETLGADLMQAEARVAARLDAALRQTYGRRSFDAALSSDRAVMMREIRDQLRERSRYARHRDRRRPRAPHRPHARTCWSRPTGAWNPSATRWPQDIRSQGEATKTRMNAETDRDVTEKLAEARRQSEIIRGEGDAERNRVFAEAFEQDPEFFTFYRSMQAYAKSLAHARAPPWCSTRTRSSSSTSARSSGTPAAAAPAQ